MSIARWVGKSSFWVWSKVVGEEQSHMGLEVVEFLGSGKKALEEFLAAQTT